MSCPNIYIFNGKSQKGTYKSREHAISSSCPKSLSLSLSRKPRNALQFSHLLSRSASIIFINKFRRFSVFSSDIQCNLSHKLCHLLQFVPYHPRNYLKFYIWQLPNWFMSVSLSPPLLSLSFNFLSPRSPAMVICSITPNFAIFFFWFL